MTDELLRSLLFKEHDRREPEFRSLGKKRRWQKGDEGNVQTSVAVEISGDRTAGPVAIRQAMSHERILALVLKPLDAATAARGLTAVMNGATGFWTEASENPARPRT